MLRPGAALGAREVVPPVALIQVRAFDPDRLAGQIHAAIEQHLARADWCVLRDIEALHPDGAMPVVQRRALRRAVVEQVGAAIGIEEQGRVDTVDAGQPRQCRPWARGIVGTGDEIATAVDRGAHHVKAPVVMADAGGIHAARHAQPVVIELLAAVDHVADLGPMHKIGTLQHRDRREIRERRIDQVIALSHARDAGVRVEPGQHRIAVVPGRQRRGEYRIVAAVFEPVERNIGRGLRLRVRRHRQGHQQGHTRGRKRAHHQSHIAPSSSRAIGNCLGT